MCWRPGWHTFVKRRYDSLARKDQHSSQKDRSMIAGINVTNQFAVVTHDGDRFASGRHDHRQAQLLYAVRGVVSVTTDDGTWVVPPSRAVWLPPHVEHETASRSRVQFRSLLIDTSELRNLPDKCMVV